MKLEEMLAQIDGSASSNKTAALVTTPPVTNSSDAAEILRQALKEAAAEPSATKVSAAAPIESLVKLAARTSEEEYEAITKEAMHYGAACADGFIARLALYQEAGEKLAGRGVSSSQDKVAGVIDEGFEKFAAANPDIVKEAHALGYASTKAMLAKLAEEAWVKGYNTTVERIHKHATDCYVTGVSNATQLLEQGVR